MVTELEREVKHRERRVAVEKYFMIITGLILILKRNTGSSKSKQPYIHESLIPIKAVSVVAASEPDTFLVLSRATSAQAKSAVYCFKAKSDSERSEILATIRHLAFMEGNPHSLLYADKIVDRHLYLRLSSPLATRKNAEVADVGLFVFNEESHLNEEVTSISKHYSKVLWFCHGA